MVQARCPNCLREAGRKSGVMTCSCGATIRIRKNGDVGFQIDAVRPKRAAKKVVNGEVKTNDD